jgi:hypothetical protein
MTLWHDEVVVWLPDGVHVEGPWRGYTRGPLAGARATRAANFTQIDASSSSAW